MSERTAPAIIAARDESLLNLALAVKEELAAGRSFDNRRLTALAEQCYGGTRSEGRYTPKDAYDAQEAGLNRWLLDGLAKDLLQTSFDEALITLRRVTGQLARQTDRTEEQIEFQQFSTPPPLAFIAFRLLAPQPGEAVIDPSAGTGNLITWAQAFGCQTVSNEIAERRLALLRWLGFDPHDVDAELLNDLLPVEVAPAGVIMNPPFSATAGRLTRHDPIYGAKHIESALRRLEPQGRLVAIAANSMAMNATKFRDWWIRIAKLYNVRANYTVGGREFAKFGTDVNVQLIVIDKDGVTPGTDWEDQKTHVEHGKADSLVAAWEDLKHLALREPRAETEEDTAAPAQVFVPYEVQRLTGGAAHPAKVVESASMAAIPPPPPTYRPHLNLAIVDDKLLSLVQLERVVYAGQRHEQRLPNGARAGFFVGDGTGIGKGRIISGIITDNWNQGHRRVVWFSVNSDLLPSAKRDLTDIGSGHIPVARINDYATDGDIELGDGVIFCPYPSLISQSKGKHPKKRIDQIIRWLGKDGVAIFDEAHKAKNALAGGRGEPTQTGQAVIDIQDPEQRPDLRVIYSSATGATDVRNMAYMTRLGLWGEGTAFSTGFKQFLHEIEEGGVGAMEMVSRELKALGMYLSSSISFEGVEYHTVIHRLTEQQREMYDHAARAWQQVLQRIDEAVEITGAGSRQKGNALNKFWGDHQRFFSLLVTAIKAPTLIQVIQKALDEGKSPLVSLVNTGESRTKDKVSQAVISGASLDDLDFTPREIIATMIERAFPVIVHQQVEDPETGRVYAEPVIDKKTGKLVESREALQMRQELLDGLSALYLPDNPLDQIVNHFGQDKVAELTGRKRRLIRDNDTGKTTYQKRNPDGVAMALTNVYEIEQYQSGKKLIAVFSDAAAQGISLHASNRCENKRRRAHITLQFGWSADQAMQKFGRSHRSDQALPPEYWLVSTDLDGELRFLMTIARRLASLGALTKGDRAAADSGDLSKYNFETNEGADALSLMFRQITRGDEIPGLDDPRQTLRDMGLLAKNADGVEKVRAEDERNVPRFLNRVLALDVHRQNALFRHFSGLFDRAVLEAKKNGTYDAGVTDIRAMAVRFATKPRVVARDEVTGAETTLYILEVDRAIKTCPFEQADAERQAKTGSAYLRHKRKGYICLAVPSRTHTDVDTGEIYRTFAIWTPEGDRVKYRRDSDLEKKFFPVEVCEAREWWNLTHDALPKVRTEKLHIIGGAILPLWSRLKAGQSTGRLYVLRVTTDDGKRIVGAWIPEKRVGEVLRSVGVSRNLKTPEEIFHAVMNQGDRVELVQKLYLVRMEEKKQAWFWLGGEVQYSHHATLRQIGMIDEYKNYRWQFYVPTDAEQGIPVLAALLKQFPPLRSNEEVAAEIASGDYAPSPAQIIVPVDIRQLIVPVGVKPKAKQRAASRVFETPAPEPVKRRATEIAVQQTLFDDLFSAR